MNGAQDLGGMQGFGPVVPDTPATHDTHFHDPWERRAFALTVAMGATGSWNLDMARAARESLPPAQYLSSGYYRIWFEALVKLMLERGLVTPQELAEGHASVPPAALPRTLKAQDVAAVLARGGPTERPAPAPARFAVGDRVLTRNMHPRGHTRLPRYVRGRHGTIASLHGAHIFPDAHALGQGEAPQWLYSVRFEARELWGGDTTASSIHVDCWESYLEPV
jgi:nitrile hydratase subunit beta